MTRGPLCMTELHTWNDHGQVVSLTMCRHEMRLSTHGARGHSGIWVFVCPDSEHCGTARVLTGPQMREVMAT